MLSLRNRFGIPGVIAVLALAFAMIGGTALAANSGDGATASAKNNRKGGGNVNKLIKREARKFSKAFSLRFAKRFPGPIGPQGFPGLPGAPGEDGDDGSDGDNGADGQEGEDGATGPTGPIGPEGPEGPEGSPWTLGGTLPSGETLTGMWAGGPLGEFETTRAPISFPIPLAAVITGSNVHTNQPGYDGEGSGDCPGTAASPEAAAGHLCVYATILDKSQYAFEASGGFADSIVRAGPGTTVLTGAGISGAAVALIATENGGNGFGSWAVTAP